MKSLKGTRTEKNLLASFAGESQARTRYTFASSAAKKEGFVQISNIFMETAENEKEHAKRFFGFLEGGGLEITATYPAGKLDNTAANLLAAADGEHEEFTDLYPAMAKIAAEEGFDEIARVYEMISKVEEKHYGRYTALLKNVKEGLVFKRPQPVLWKCLNCGFVSPASAEAPKLCPACNHPQAYFEIAAFNW